MLKYGLLLRENGFQLVQVLVQILVKFYSLLLDNIVGKYLMVLKQYLLLLSVAVAVDQVTMMVAVEQVED